MRDGITTEVHRYNAFLVTLSLGCLLVAALAFLGLIVGTRSRGVLPVLLLPVFIVLHSQDRGYHLHDVKEHGAKFNFLDIQLAR